MCQSSVRNNVEGNYHDLFYLHVSAGYGKWVNLRTSVSRATMEPGTSPVRSEFARNDRKMRWRIPVQCSVYIFSNVVKNHNDKSSAKVSWFIFRVQMPGSGTRSWSIRYFKPHFKRRLHRAAQSTGNAPDWESRPRYRLCYLYSDSPGKWSWPLSHPYKSPMIISHIIPPFITSVVDAF
jgi:hypothetical protein